MDDSGGAAAFGAAPHPDPALVVDTYPLTPMQFGLAFESTLGGRASANVEQIVCRFQDEAIDPDRLRGAWRSAIARHEVLRTSFRLEGVEGPRQRVHREAPCPFEVLDWTSVDDAELEDQLASWLSSDRAAGVDLAAAPALRVALIELAPTRSIMVWTFHHAILDGRSFAVVLEEVLDEYAGTGTDLGPGTAGGLRFRHHVDAVTTADREAARAFFSRMFHGFDTSIAAPGARTELRPDPALPTGHREVERRLSEDLVARLERRVGAADATVGSALLAAWAVLVSRYSLTDDVVFGTTRAGRHAVDGAEDLVGCLINTVPIRLGPRADLTVDQLLTEVRTFQLEVRDHEHTAMVDIQSWTEVAGDRPLLGSNVVFERELLGSRLRRRGGLWTTRAVSVLEETSFPLVLAAYLDDGLLLRLEYDAAVYDPHVVDRLGDHLARLLRSLAEAPDGARVGDLGMLSEAERTLLLVERNPVPPPVGDETYADRFERQAARRPDHVAVESLADGSSCTYAELDERSDRLAHLLVAAGASPAHPVGICLPRSIEFVETVLAVLKAGAAYLPLDPSYPESALAHMIDDSGARLVVAGHETVSRLPETSARVLVPERLAAELAGVPGGPPSRERLTPADPAYVIYTSGSTGAPKGVAVSNRSLVGYSAAVADRYELVESDRHLQFASLSFDVSVEEILPNLAVGATVVLRSEDLAGSMGALVEATETAGLTALNLPSAVWHALVEHLEHTGARLAPSVRLVVVGGEKVARRSYEIWTKLHPEIRWLNGYGPTETTVTCTVYDPAGRYRVGSGDEIPIGRPLSNARAYVLDVSGTRPVPDGQVGELWIGGSGVGIGYLGRPELTEERFRPDPYSPQPGARMYRTGDRARWLPSGDLEFLGRTDRQVKLRGFRIEPGEIERVIESQPEVRQAFVALRPGPSGDDRLVAWVSLVLDDGSIDLEVLRAIVAHSLPAHAVPSTLVATDELARTPGGKVDLAALPAPTWVSGARADLEPANDSEARLCEVFGEVLGAGGPVGVEDSFFERGGHSLLAVRLLSRIEVEWGVRSSLATLHAAPTPRALAASLLEAGVEPQLAYLAPIQPLGDLPPLYGIHVLGANGSFYRPLAARLGPDQPVFGLSIAEPDEATPTAVEDIAALYVDEILRHQPEGPFSLAAISLGGYVAFEVAQQLAARGRRPAVLALIDSPGPGGRQSVSPLRRMAIHVAKLREVGPSYLVESVRRLAGSLGERVDGLRLRLHRLLGRETPDDLWMHRFVLANVAAAASYQARPYPGPVTVFHAAGERFDAPDTVSSGLGWAHVAAGGLEVIEVPGEHVSMLEEPYVSHLASELRATMEQALPAT